MKKYHGVECIDETMPGGFVLKQVSDRYRRVWKDFAGDTGARWSDHEIDSLIQSKTWVPTKKGRLTMFMRQVS